MKITYSYLENYVLVLLIYLILNVHKAYFSMHYVVKVEE